MGTIFDEKNKVWRSVLDQPPTIEQNISFGQMILNRLSANGSKVAQVNDDTGAQITFHEIWLNTIRAAQNLQKRGFQPRQVFSCMAANSDHLVSMLLASFCLTCPIAPLHPMLSKEELIRIVAKTKPSVIFCDSSAYDHLNEALKELQFDVKVFTFGERIEGVEAVENLLIETGDETNFVPLECDREKDIAAIFCSSGTTGPSKCVCVSYECAALKFTPCQGVALSFDPIYWTIGLKPITNSIYNGTTRIITTKPFSPELQIKLIEKYRVDYLFNPPFNMVSCLRTSLINKMDLSSVKIVALYGCKIPSTLIAEAESYFPNAKFVSVYGMTEIGKISHNILDAHTATNSGLLGAGCVAKIVDDDGNRCGPNVKGEVRIKNKNEFLGYLDDPVATAAAFDDEDFFRTGDCGYFDENGKLFFEDRIKNFIRVYYFRIAIIASEIEEFLTKMPGIEEVSVVGIPIACGSGLPAAVIVPKAGSNLSEREVFDAVAENFPIRSRLRGGVYFVESLPKTHSGKLIHREATEVATEQFRAIKDSDPDIQSYLSDIPEEFRNQI